MANLKQSIGVNATPQQIYDIWMDSKKHADLINADAKIDPKVGGKFKMWGGSIEGENLELEPGEKIVQKWRGNDWPEDVYSKITIKFKKGKNGETRLLFWQTGIPEDQLKDVTMGWNEYYWSNLKEMFK